MSRVLPLGDVNMVPSIRAKETQTLIAEVFLLFPRNQSAGNFLLKSPIPTPNHPAPAKVKWSAP